MPIVLTVTMNDDRSVAVNGPIQDKVLCYGMLAVAQEAIRDHHEANKRLIQVPQMGVSLPGMKGD